MLKKLQFPFNRITFEMTSEVCEKRRLVSYVLFSLIVL